MANGYGSKWTAGVGVVTRFGDPDGHIVAQFMGEFYKCGGLLPNAGQFGGGTPAGGSAVALRRTCVVGVEVVIDYIPAKIHAPVGVVTPKLAAPVNHCPDIIGGVARQPANNNFHGWVGVFHACARPQRFFVAVVKSR